MFPVRYGRSVYIQSLRILVKNVHTMAQAISPRTVIAEARVRFQVNLYEFYDGQSGTRTSFSPSYLVFPCLYHYTNAPCHLLVHVAFTRTIRRSVGTFQKTMLNGKLGSIR